MPPYPPVPGQPELPVGLADNALLPRPAQLQRSTGERDQVLTSLVRRQRPTVAWWWAVRRTRGHMGAHCWLCDQQIVRGALNVRITSEQQDVIEAHQLAHWQQWLQTRAEQG